MNRYFIGCLWGALALSGCGKSDDDGSESCTKAQQFTAWIDSDGDGLGNPNAPITVCRVERGQSAFDQDCNDSDAAINPFAEEICNGSDDDCDGRIDEFFITTPFWDDADADGYGDSEAVPQWACVAPEGAATAAGDCDDGDPVIYPGSTEHCNDGVDDDCDGLLDDEDDTIDPLDLTTFYRDDDGDGYGDPASMMQRCEAPPGAVLDGSDCADGIAAVNPLGAEICNNIDDDCDTFVDDADVSVDPTTFRDWFLDADYDGHGDATNLLQQCAPPAGYVPSDDDCDDTDATVLGETPWLPDQDSDGFGVAPPTVFACALPGPYLASGLIAQDCDDYDPMIFPGGSEVCNGRDDDCDGNTDDNDGSLDPTTATDWYYDFDLDGHGTPASWVTRCNQPFGTAPTALDCNDANADVNPDASEICNDIDDDCDLAVDDADPSVDPLTWSVWYLDGDLDGWGAATGFVASCDPPGGYTDNAMDCDDADPGIGSAELWLSDQDMDGFGTDTLPPVGVSCTPPVPDSARMSAGIDCDDGDGATWPGAPEVCLDGIDQDCNTLDDCTLLAEDWETGFVDPLVWGVTGDAALSAAPALGGWSMRLGGGVGTVDSAYLDTSGCAQLDVHYMLKRGPAVPGVGDQIWVQYWDGATWRFVEQVSGSGVEDAYFQPRDIDVTALSAFTATFALRFTTVGDGVGTDDFFVDDISLICQ